MPITVVGLDGDDTLWHNETRFNVTQGELRDLLRRHIHDADVDAQLAETEMRNLGMYGYGVKAVTLSMIETAIELSAGKVSSTDIQTIIDAGKEMLAHPVDLLDGVDDALAALAERYRLMLVTKGDLFDQESKLARSGVADRFWRVVVVAVTAARWISLVTCARASTR